MEPIRRRRVVPPAQLELPEAAEGAGPPSPVDVEAKTAPAVIESEVDSLDDGWDVPPTLPAEPAAERAAPPASGSVPAVVKAPDAVVKAPDAVVKAPDAVVKAPDAVVKAPDAVVRAPDAVVRASEASNGDAKRRHDMRAPRASRSTRESTLYKQEQAAPREPRVERPRDERPREPRIERPRDDRPRDDRPRESRVDAHVGERERVRDLLGPRRPDRLQQMREPLRDIEKTSPSPVDMPAFARPKPKPAVVAPVVALAPPPPAAPNLAEELRVFGAKPVIERKQKASKSMTAKEVLRQKTKAITDARPGPKTLRSGEVAAASEPADVADAAESSDTESARDKAPKNDTKNSSSNRTASSNKKRKHAAKVNAAKESARKEAEEDEPISLPKPSFWARVKGFFSGG